MKVRSLAILILTVVTVMTMGLLASPLQASQYLGEITWDVLDSLGHTFTVKAGLSKVGGSYYELQGQAAPAAGTIIFSGGGALVGTTLMLSGTGTMVETNSNGVYHDAQVWQMSINQSTFNGTMWMVTNWYNPAFTPPFGQSYTTLTLTKTSGPSNPAAASIVPLLLQ